MLISSIPMATTSLSPGGSRPRRATARTCVRFAPRSRSTVNEGLTVTETDEFPPMMARLLASDGVCGSYVRSYWARRAPASEVGSSRSAGRGDRSPGRDHVSDALTGVDAVEALVPSRGVERRQVGVMPSVPGVGPARALVLDGGARSAHRRPLSTYRERSEVGASLCHLVRDSGRLSGARCGA